MKIHSPNALNTYKMQVISVAGCKFREVDWSQCVKDRELLLNAESMSASLDAQ